MSALQPINISSRHEDELGDRSRHGLAAAHIDRSPVRAFFVLSAFYFVAVLGLSSLKLLWLDELITLQIARLGSLSAIWQALQHGVDPNPPVTHMLVHFSRMIFGDHEFALRLPAILGYWTGLLSLFVYLRSRLTPTWALAGTVLSMTMGAFEYSYESRSYGIFYGLAMLALLCWCKSIDSTASFRSGGLWLIGMSLALALGISTNYFAVLAFLPIATGEAVRTCVTIFRLRRGARKHDSVLRIAFRNAIDYRIWIALLLAASPLLAFRSMIAHSIAQFGPYAWNKVSLQQVFDSYTEMVEIVLYPIVAVLLVFIPVRLLNKRVRALCACCRSTLMPRWLAAVVVRPLPQFRLPLHEAAAVAAFMAYPLLGYLVASIHGGMLSPRFVIPVCFGFAIATTVALFKLLGDLRYAGTITLSFLFVWFIARESYVGYWYEEQKECFYKVLNHLPQAEAAVPADAPIVIADPLLVLTFEHYAPPALASRAVFPVDFPAIRFFRHDDSPEENLWAGRNFLYSLKIEPLAIFENSASKYLIIASDGNWLLDDLDHHHYGTRRLPINTRAGAIGGFTPLAHGTPAFYVADAHGQLINDGCRILSQIPFKVSENLPGARPFGSDGDLE